MGGVYLHTYVCNAFADLNVWREETMDQTLNGEVRWHPEHEVPGVRLNHLTSDLEVLAVTAGPEPRFPPVFLLVCLR